MLQEDRTVHWICFGDSAKGILACVRRDIAPGMDMEHILSIEDDYSQGDIAEVINPAAWEENAPLRAIVGGKVQSVPADFYDEVILSCVPAEIQPAALTVGRALLQTEQQMGNRLSDMQIFARIRALAAAERIEVVHDAENYREMTICRR